jgi:hypothetical protein
MPAIDKCEPAVIRALEKVGWIVKERPYPILISDEEAEYLFADLLMQKLQNRDEIIVIEVKCFTQKSKINELYTAVGQYQAYRDTLAWNHLDISVYLAIPEEEYRTLLRLPGIKYFIEHTGVKWILVSIAKEEIIEWKT